MGKVYCVYMLASRSRVLYTGVTGQLLERVKQHRQGLVPGFTSRYRIRRLVYFESFSSPKSAITREKEIKSRGTRLGRIWRRSILRSTREKQIPHAQKARVRDDSFGFVAV